MTKQLFTLGLALLSGGMAVQAKSAKDQKDEQHPKKVYGDNIIRFSPVKAMDIGVGPGISYERIISADKKIGLVLPFSVLLADYYDDYYYNYNYNNASYSSYFYFTPGLKFYPFGQRTVTYAIGPNLMFGYGGSDRNRPQYNPLTQTYYTEHFKNRVFRLGILVNNYVNFQITPAFNIGVSAGLGVRYIDHEAQTIDGNKTVYNHPINATGQGTLSIGYRF
ncbi:MAG TPA: hypothetical protein VFL76_03365 [Edaphocola sp.]|nr:hypothetical protein [Edaphocola sp.]